MLHKSNDYLFNVFNIAGRRNVEIGKIDLYKTYSTVEVEEGAGNALLKNSRGMHFHGTFFDAKIMSDNRRDNGDYDRRNRGYPGNEGSGEFKRRDRKKRF